MDRASSVEKVVSLIFRQTRERERERSSIFHSSSLPYACSCSPLFTVMPSEEPPDPLSHKNGFFSSLKVIKVLFHGLCTYSHVYEYALGQMACWIETKALSQMRGIAVKIEICPSLSTLDSQESQREPETERERKWALMEKTSGHVFPSDRPEYTARESRGRETGFQWHLSSPFKRPVWTQNEHMGEHLPLTKASKIIFIFSGAWKLHFIWLCSLP